MAGTKTFFIIKPGAVSHEFIGPILAKINANGFHIAALKLIMLDHHHAEHFYSVHRGKPFFESLVNFMTSGPVVVGILEKENAVLIIADSWEQPILQKPRKEPSGNCLRRILSEMRCTDQTVMRMPR